MKTYAIEHILVPMDFSDLSLCALAHAERIAKVTSARIILQHIVAPREGGFGTSGMMSIAARLEEQQEEEAAKRLREIAAKLHRRTRLPVNSVTGIGHVPSLINQTASDVHANLIVMGTHGATGFMENLLGSITYRVAGRSQVPVLCVNKKPSREEYSHLIYPIRDKTQAMKKYPYAVACARLFGARAHVVGLLLPKDKPHEIKMRTLCKSLRNRFQKDGIRAEMSFAKTTEFPVATLQYAHAYSNALVVIAQDYDFLLTELFKGTFSKAILHRILSPVLTIPS